MFRRGLPLIIAVFFGVVTLLSLLFSIPEISSLILEWASFLAAVALLLGVINLFSVHTQRMAGNRPVGGQNLYSAVLVISMLVVFGLGLTDLLGITENGTGQVFNWVQAPLEAALASLLAFFLLFSGIRLLQRQRTVYSILFLVTAVLILLSNALIFSPLLPQSASLILQQLRDFVQNVIVTSGMRGILLGVALGAITLSIRLLLGLERPYNK
ncbi:MAG: hypothetical protein KC441_03965 [Anaerolineales bacterium]|nr:hypothetical protein [Anaerolineales bacterium]MCB8987691.1 hypothetical protein [Ardenticatenaceae bacterium]